jgi:hypothetical protein
MDRPKPSHKTHTDAITRLRRSLVDTRLPLLQMPRCDRVFVFGCSVAWCDIMGIALLKSRHLGSDVALRFSIRQRLSIRWDRLPIGRA